MPDELDDQIRAAMKTLDDEVPSGYFDALPNQILTRLEDGSMQHGSGTTETRSKPDALMGPPVTASPEKKPERDEDSGLHDIRNLAQSTKQRLSSRRITQNPMSSDDDVLASSSGSWKNIALPQPAKMVALPELSELPSKAEVLAAEKAAAKRLAEKTKKAAKAAKAETPDDEVLAPVATANAALASMSAVPVPERQAFSLPSQDRKSSKGPLLAIVGLGLAAAAGGVIYMQTNKKDSAPTAATATAEQPAQVASAPTAEPIEKAAPAAAAPAEEAVDTGAAGATADQDAADEGADKNAAEANAMVASDDTASERPKTHRKGKAKKASDDEDKTEDKPEKTVVVEEKKEPEVKADKPKAKGDENEPSFDALLKEAGVEDKKPEKPKLEKKKLTGDDFKQGMGAIAGKAQGCYKGTVGTAMVKLVVAPSGKVTKVTVGGQFAGKPEAACVEAAVKSASFPPWDGGPQSFNYSYMLAD